MEIGWLNDQWMVAKVKRFIITGSIMFQDLLIDQNCCSKPGDSYPDQ